MSKKKVAQAQKPQTQSVARVAEHKGHPVIALHKYPDDKYPFSFGTVKAGLILAHFPDIQAFFGKHNAKQEASAAA